MFLCSAYDAPTVAPRAGGDATHRDIRPALYALCLSMVDETRPDPG